jgi:hypothetical protein
MEDKFLDWAARYSTWPQAFKIMWWLTFNNKKSNALEQYYKDGMEFQAAYNKVQKNEKNSI